MSVYKDHLLAHGDSPAAEAWVKAHITDAPTPPISFTADDVSSDTLTWTREWGEPVTHTDYPTTDNPAERREQTVTYTTPAVGLAVTVTVTSYPDYPVVEYAASVKNLRDSVSPRLQNLLSVDHPILTEADGVTLHSYTGAIYSHDAFRPHEQTLTEGDTAHFEVTGGRPTSTWWQGFNLEHRASGRGVVAVPSWAGNWRSDITVKDGVAAFSAGQLQTDIVLLPREDLNLPLTVLLYYRGTHIDGQNLWRRWLWEHNIHRHRGLRDGVRTLCCVGEFPDTRTRAEADLKTVAFLRSEGLAGTLVNELAQDAGWYDLREGWYDTGNWYPDPARYPDGLRPVSDALHEAGMQYRVWFEPERMFTGRTHAKRVLEIDREGLIALVPDGEGGVLWADPATQPDGTNTLVNYSIPAVADFTVEYINDLITRFGVDIYRQDYNIEPAPFWSAYDRHISEVLGLPRFGVTEEKYIRGYRKLWDSITARHPGIIIDACAGGAMRNDLETVRYSQPHTRTDWFFHLEHTQDHTYGAAQWMVLMGGACAELAPFAETTNMNPYEWRSETITSRAVSFIATAYDPERPFSREAVAAMKQELTDWRRFAGYLLYDFYPLTPYDRSTAAWVAYQYDCPEEGCGMAVIYARPDTRGETVIYPTALRPDGIYTLHDEDGAQPDRTVSGQTLMTEGIPVSAADKPMAFWFTYRLTTVG